MNDIATIKEIADVAGVSRGTVDRVLNSRGYVNTQTAEKVRQAAKMLHYTPNRFAQALSARRNSTKIGVVLFRSSNKLYDEIIRGVQSQAKNLSDAGCKLLIHPCRDISAEDQLEAIASIVEQSAQGLILSPVNDAKISEKVSELHQDGIPVITVNSDVKNTDRLCYVGSNYYVSGKTASALLGMITNGLANVGIVTGFHSIECHSDRIAGFKEKIVRSFPGLHITEIAENHDDEFISYSVTREMLLRHPEISALYLSGGGVYGACRAVLDLNLDSRLKIVCHDDTPEIKRMIYNNVITATICQEPFKQGALAVQLMFDYLTYGSKPQSQLYFTDNIIKIKDNLENPGTEIGMEFDDEAEKSHHDSKG